MHGIHASLARRIEAVARRLGALQEPETNGERARRLELVRAAYAGHEPADLTADEARTFWKIAATVPIVRELVDEGIVDADGEPGGDDHPDRDDDLDEDSFGEFAWSP